MKVERHEVGPRMSQIVIHGDTIYLAGIVAQNSGGKSVTDRQPASRIHMVESTSGVKPKIGLILTGGGARAAYQIGFLRAVSHMLPRGAPNPFQIICGTSAGAVNAAVLAAGATEFGGLEAELRDGRVQAELGHEGQEQ